MLANRALWFSRGDELGDTYEGVMSQSSFEELVAFFEEMDQFVPPTPDKIPTREVARDLASQAYIVARSIGFFNCWHMSPYESMAMWKIYAANVIAVQSTFRRLTESFSRRGERSVRIGTIQYLDHYSDYTNRYGLNVTGSHFAQFWMSKGKAYEFEREIRAVSVIEPPRVDGPPNYDHQDHPKGINVPCDLNRLIEAVYISPTRPEYFVEVVSSLTALYGFGDVPVIQSQLAKTPPWVAKK